MKELERGASMVDRGIRGGSGRWSVPSEEQ